MGWTSDTVQQTGCKKNGFLPNMWMIVCIIPLWDSNSSLIFLPWDMTGTLLCYSGKIWIYFWQDLFFLVLLWDIPLTGTPPYCSTIRCFFNRHSVLLFYYELPLTGPLGFLYCTIIRFTLNRKSSLLFYCKIGTPSYCPTVKYEGNSSIVVCFAPTAWSFNSR